MKKFLSVVIALVSATALLIVGVAAFTHFTQKTNVPKYVFLFIGDGMSFPQIQSTAEYVAYGSYEPLTVTITHILDNKSGLSFHSYSHTGLPAAMFADGVNAKRFDGYYDNTEIYVKLAEMLGVK